MGAVDFWAERGEPDTPPIYSRIPVQTDNADIQPEGGGRTSLNSKKKRAVGGWAGGLVDPLAGLPERSELPNIIRRMPSPVPGSVAQSPEWPPGSSESPKKEENLFPLDIRAWMSSAKIHIYTQHKDTYD